MSPIATKILLSPAFWSFTTKVVLAVVDKLADDDETELTKEEASKVHKAVFLKEQRQNET